MEHSLIFLAREVLSRSKERLRLSLCPRYVTGRLGTLDTQTRLCQYVQPLFVDGQWKSACLNSRLWRHLYHDIKPFLQKHSASQRHLNLATIASIYSVFIGGCLPGPWRKSCKKRRGKGQRAEVGSRPRKLIINLKTSYFYIQSYFIVGISYKILTYNFK